MWRISWPWLRLNSISSWTWQAVTKTWPNSNSLWSIGKRSSGENKVGWKWWIHCPLFAPKPVEKDEFMLFIFCNIKIWGASEKWTFRKKPGRAKVVLFLNNCWWPSNTLPCWSKRLDRLKFDQLGRKGPMGNVRQFQDSTAGTGST